MKVFRFGSTLLALSVSLASAQSGSLTIESWRNDDLTIWQETIIPAFNAQYPDIEVTFAPSAPAEYNAALNAKLEAGSAGDLITCRPFDLSLDLFNEGHLESLNDLPGMENFSDVAKVAWSTDDGSETFCVPMASVIHGFIYNADAFNELGLEEPETYEDFLALLQTIREEGTYEPLVMGTADQWESATMGYQNIGPNYWEGEAGRQALIDGSLGYDEDGFLEAFEALAAWQPYLMNGYQATAYPDAQAFFTLGGGAIYPAGSWDISVFRSPTQGATFELGAFAPPPPAGQEGCYISDHTDIGMGLNAASENKEAAQVFLEWMTTPEFAELYANALPGFFPLSDAPVTLEDPLAQEFLSWREECESTIRSSYQILSRGEPNNENQLWNVSSRLLNGEISAQEAGQIVQEGLEAWYEPQQGN
jgi:raffinose/stachyose/melibiose transport system substrate-binding protein